MREALDLRRAALFFFMTPVLAALSIALYVLASNLTSFVFFSSFIAALYAFFLARFPILLAFDCLSAFLADFVIGILCKIYHCFLDIARNKNARFLFLHAPDLLFYFHGPLVIKVAHGFFHKPIKLF